MNRRIVRIGLSALLVALAALACGGKSQSKKPVIVSVSAGCLIAC